MSDIAGTIEQLFVYPIKSCGGICVQESTLTESGLAWDRAFMVVDADGNFFTQRELPRMVLIKPRLTGTALELEAPGVKDVSIPFATAGRSIRVQVWSDDVPAHDMGDVAAGWFTEFLGQPLRLVRFDTAHRRLSNMQWTGGTEAPNQFSDGFPLLMLSSAALGPLNERLLAVGQPAVGPERFRPNVVIGGFGPHDEDRCDTVRIATEGGEVRLKPVKPCTRCTVPNVDAATGISSPAVGDMLQSYRQDARMDGAVTFGMNAIVVHGNGATLKLGQAVAADLRFD